MRNLVALWLVVLACTYQSNVRLGGTSNEPADTMVQQVAEQRAKQQRDAIRVIGTSYDTIRDRIEEGVALAAAKRFEPAIVSYRKAQLLSAQMLVWFKNPNNQLGRGPDIRYTTKRDGSLDEAMLVGNLRIANDHARKQAMAAWDGLVEELVIELHVRTPDQRAVLQQHGRPDVHKVGKQTCWSYRGLVADDVYCWAKRGKLAKHDHIPRQTVVAKNPRRPVQARPQPVPVAPPQQQEQEPTEAWQPVEQPAQSDNGSQTTADNSSSTDTTTADNTQQGPTGKRCSFDSDCGAFKCRDGICGHCSFDSDCPGGTCRDNVCGAAGGGCSFDSDCGGLRCLDGKCGRCSFDSDCPGGKCSANLCTNVGGECSFDSDCPPNNSGHCVDRKCQQ